MTEKTPLYNAQNERVKKEYLRHKKEAKQKAESTLDGIRKALHRFEEYIGFKDFATFNKEQAIGFKRHMAASRNQRTGEPISKSTILHAINALKDFFIWLSYRPGFKSKIDRYDIDYFNLSEKEVRMAREPRFRDIATVEQIMAAIDAMPAENEIQLRDRAVMAFILLTGVRDGALVSLKIKHIDLTRSLVKQDPREVKTKMSKAIYTYFFPVDQKIADIVVSWVNYLKKQKLYGNNDPLFPRTKLGLDPHDRFKAVGLEPVHWQNSSPVRKIVKQAFEAVGLPHFTPHSFRHTLVSLGEQLCQTPEQFKAWSQNLGHEEVMTTFTSYGYVQPVRQGEVLKKLAGNNAHSVS